MNSRINDLELLLLNAKLRDELEPFHDESLDAVDTRRMTTAEENRYLRSLLAWERAPVLPIRDWFHPPLDLPPHEALDDTQVSAILRQTIDRLAQRNIVLESTGHLSDRQLYCLLQRDILPSQEKLLAEGEHCLVWQCLNPVVDEESWLRYYATDEEREQWWLETGLPLPPKSPLPYPR